MDSTTQVLTGRPFEGLGVVVDLGDSILLGIEADMNGIKAMFINIYMSCDCADNGDEFLMYLGKTNDFTESYPTPYIYVVEYFNVNLFVRGHTMISKFVGHLTDFCAEEKVILADVHLLNDNSFTYISPVHNSVSWLDHIITTATGFDIISNIAIIHYLVSSDHLPIVVQLDCNCLHVTGYQDTQSKSHIDWSVPNDEAITSYNNNSAKAISKLILDYDPLMYTNVSCCDNEHRLSIDKTYMNIINAISDSSRNLLPGIRTSK